MDKKEEMDTIKFFMEDQLVSVSPENSVHETVQIMAEKKIGAIMIAKGDEYIGIFTETDLLRKVIAEEKPVKDVKVEDVMSHPLTTIDMNSSMVAGFLTMQQKNIRHLAVTENKKVIGILSIKDIANYYINKFRPK